MSRHKGWIPVRKNLGLVALFVVMNLTQFILMPFLIQLDPLFAFGLIPIALSTPTLWALAHESFHGSLHPNASANKRLGRVLCLLFGAPWLLLRFTHLLHHKMSRTSYDSADIYDPGQKSWLKAAISYYPNLLIGLYLTELIANLLLLLPERYARPLVRWIFASDPKERTNTSQTAERALMNPVSLRELRLDALLVIFFFGASFWLYGVYWPFLLLALLGRGMIISILDNAPHYGTPLGDSSFSYNLELPPQIAAFWLNFNLHRVHHIHPQLPWSKLPEFFDETDAHYDGHCAGIILQQFRGPVRASSRPVTNPFRHPDHSFIELR